MRYLWVRIFMALSYKHCFLFNSSNNPQPTASLYRVGCGVIGKLLFLSRKSSVSKRSWQILQCYRVTEIQTEAFPSMKQLVISISAGSRLTDRLLIPIQGDSPFRHKLSIPHGRISFYCTEAMWDLWSGNRAPSSLGMHPSFLPSFPCSVSQHH